MDKRRQIGGFTLTELIVVVAALSLLVAIAIPSMRIRDAHGLHSATLEVSGLFELARSQAQAFGNPARVIVHDDLREEDRYRRVIGVVRQKDDGAWTFVANPLILPEGVYFDGRHRGAAIETMMHRGARGEEHNWLFYEIGPGPSVSHPARSVVLGSGYLNRRTGVVEIPNPRLTRGFWLTDNARPLFYDSYEEMNNIEF